MRLTKNSKGQEKPKNSQDVSTGPGGVYHTLLPPKPTETPQLVIEEKESAADRSTFDSWVYIHVQRYNLFSLVYIKNIFGSVSTYSLASRRDPLAAQHVYMHKYTCDRQMNVRWGLACDLNVERVRSLMSALFSQYPNVEVAARNNLATKCDIKWWRDFSYIFSNTCCSFAWISCRCLDTIVQMWWKHFHSDAGAIETVKCAKCQFLKHVLQSITLKLIVKTWTKTVEIQSACCICS